MSGRSRAEEPLRVARKAILFVTGGLVASPVMADTGLPMLMFVWPGFLLLLVPIILVEAAWARKRLGLEWRPAVSLATRANLLSTLAGIPLAWVAMLCVELVGPPLLQSTGIIAAPSQNPPYIEHMLYTTVMAAWIPEGPRWYLPAASAALLVPFYFVSVIIEARSARKGLPEALYPQARAWAWQANLLTYVPLAATLALVAVWLGMHQR